MVISINTDPAIDSNHFTGPKFWLLLNLIVSTSIVFCISLNIFYFIMLKCSVHGVFWPKLVIWLFLPNAPSLAAQFNSNNALKLTITLSTIIMRAIFSLYVHISDFCSRPTHPWKIIFAFTLTYYIYNYHKQTCYATQKLSTLFCMIYTCIFQLHVPNTHS